MFKIQKIPSIVFTFYCRLLSFPFAIFLSFLLPSILFSDTIELKDGKIYNNVKTIINGSEIEITEQGGKKTKTNKTNIKKIKFEPVKWRGGVTNEEILRVMQEGTKFNQILQEEILATKAEIEKMRDEMREIKGIAVEALDEADKGLQIHWGSAAKSAIIPGWGQFSEGSKIKAGIIATMFIAANVNTNNTYRQYQNSVQKYNNDYITPTLINTINYGQVAFYNLIYFQNLKYQTKKNHSNHMISLGINGAIWIYCFFDALFYIPKFEKESINDDTSWKMDFSFSQKYNPLFQKKEANYQIEFNWRF